MRATPSCPTWRAASCPRGMPAHPLAPRGPPSGPATRHSRAAPSPGGRSMTRLPTRRRRRSSTRWWICWTGATRRSGPARASAGDSVPEVVIEKGDCCASFTSADHVGYRDGNFHDPSALSWTRGVVLGGVVNTMVAGVSRGWPADWWIDDGFFTALVVSDTLKQLTTPAIARCTWEIEQQLASSRVYQELVSLRDEAGWPLFQRFFSLIAGEAMDWTSVGTNPSGDPIQLRHRLSQPGRGSQPGRRLPGRRHRRGRSRGGDSDPRRPPAAGPGPGRRPGCHRELGRLPDG